MHTVTRWLVLLLMVACADEPAGSAGAELPADWAGAERIADLTQADCQEVGGWEHLYEVSVDATDAGIQVVYDRARFRCSQPVEAFARRRAGVIDVLVQPVDMNPSAPAKCDCDYRIDMHVPAAPGDYAFTLYSRGDNLSGQQTPLQVGQAEIAVR